MKWLKRKVQIYLLRKLFNVVTEEDVFTFNKTTKKCYLDGRELEEKEVRQLQEEIVFLERTWIWEIFQKTLRHQAKKAMYENSTSFEDMQAGKLMLYNLDVQKKIVENLSTGSN